MRTTCKICRRLGMSVCGREKCALKRKSYPPGVHGKSFRRGRSEYGLQLREKQKVKFLYGLRERQFKNYVLAAIRQHKIPPGEAIIHALELRLDNVLYRLGFAPTRAAARQMASHGHIHVNGKKVNVPSYRFAVGETVGIKPMSRARPLFSNLELTLKKHTPPEWLELNKSELAGKVIALPSAVDLIKAYNINVVVEYYSR